MSSYHGLGLGVEGSGEVGSVVFLEAVAGSQGVGGVVLEDAAGGVVYENEVVLTADVGQGESAHHVGADGFGLVRFAPVHVRPTGHSGGVEHVAGLHRSYVRLQGQPVLQSPASVLILDPSLFAQLTQETTNPTGSAVDQKFQLLLAAICFCTHPLSLYLLIFFFFFFSSICLFYTEGGTPQFPLLFSLLSFWEKTVIIIIPPSPMIPTLNILNLIC